MSTKEEKEKKRFEKKQKKYKKKKKKLLISGIEDIESGDKKQKIVIEYEDPTYISTETGEPIVNKIIGEGCKVKKKGLIRKKKFIQCDKLSEKIL